MRQDYTSRSIPKNLVRCVRKAATVPELEIWDKSDFSEWAVLLGRFLEGWRLKKNVAKTVRIIFQFRDEKEYKINEIPGSRATLQLMGDLLAPRWPKGRIWNSIQLPARAHLGAKMGQVGAKMARKRPT